MVRGLAWLAFLGFFVVLAGLGWHEYQKLSAYQRWATQFEQAKYDIAAVLGKNGDQLTWGQPTRQGPINLQSFSLQDVEAIYLQVDEQRIDLDHLPSRGQQVVLEFVFKTPQPPIQIPFTEIPLAAKWATFLLS